MDYRFEISLPTSSDFRCEIAVGGEQTFQQFHDKIVETLMTVLKWLLFSRLIEWETG